MNEIGHGESLRSNCQWWHLLEPQPGLDFMPCRVFQMQPSSLACSTSKAPISRTMTARHKPSRERRAPIVDTYHSVHINAVRSFFGASASHGMPDLTDPVGSMMFAGALLAGPMPRWPRRVAVLALFARLRRKSRYETIRALTIKTMTRRRS